MPVYNLPEPIELTLHLPDGTLAPSAKLLLNGVDITRACRRVVIDATASHEAGGLPRVTLELHGVQLHATVRGLLEQLIAPTTAPVSDAPDREHA